VSLPGAGEKGAHASGADRRFPRTCRLTTRRQFLTVYAEGRRVASKSFTLFGLPNSAGTCRLGITVTRKVGGAVRRNRIKRRLRDVFRRNRIHFTPHVDIVVNAHASIDVSDADAIEAEFLRTFGRLARQVEGTRG